MLLLSHKLAVLLLPVADVQVPDEKKKKNEDSHALCDGTQCTLCHRCLSTKSCSVNFRIGFSILFGRSTVTFTIEMTRAVYHKYLCDTILS